MPHLNRICIVLVCASCHVHACAFTMLFVSFQCCFLVSVTLRLWGFIWLHPFVFFMDSFFFLAGSQARWLLPLISLLSLLVSCFVLSLCCATYHLFTMPPILPCQPLTFDNFPMQTVVWLCYRFCSAPLIALLVAGEIEDFSMVDRILIGISQYLLYY